MLEPCRRSSIPPVTRAVPSLPLAQGPLLPFTALAVPVGDRSDSGLTVTVGEQEAAGTSVPWFQVGGGNDRVAGVLCYEGRGCWGRAGRSARTCVHGRRMGRRSQASPLQALPLHMGTEVVGSGL